MLQVRCVERPPRLVTVDFERIRHNELRGFAFRVFLVTFPHRSDPAVDRVSKIDLPIEAKEHPRLYDDRSMHASLQERVLW